MTKVTRNPQFTTVCERSSGYPFTGFFIQLLHTIFTLEMKTKACLVNHACPYIFHPLQPGCYGKITAKADGDGLRGKEKFSVTIKKHPDGNIQGLFKTLITIKNS